MSEDWETTIRRLDREARTATEDRHREAYRAVAMSMGARNAELKRERYAPGVGRCPKCEFRLLKTNLHVLSGTVSAGDTTGEPCPNGCGPLWRVTWEDEAREAFELVEQQVERATAAEQGRDAALAQLDKALEAWEFVRDYVLTANDGGDEAEEVELMWEALDRALGGESGEGVDDSEKDANITTYSSVSRVEVIERGRGGRLFVGYGCAPVEVRLQLQDDARTLKVFVNEPESGEGEG